MVQFFFFFFSPLADHMACRTLVACAETLSCVWLCNPMNCSPQRLLCLGFSRQEYWSGFPFSSPGNCPNPGIKPSPTIRWWILYHLSYQRIYLILFFKINLFILIGGWVLHNQFSSVTQSCPILYNPMNHSTPALPVHHQLPESTQTHIHWVGDAIQPSHPLSSPSPPALNLSQHQDLFKWVSSLHQMAKVLEFQLQHQSFQWTPRTNLI